MLGITNIASYIPENRIMNAARKEQFGIDDDFIVNKIGVGAVSVKPEHEDTSDLCVRVFHSLQEKMPVDIRSIDAIVVVTQNPDMPIPHTSAIVHGKLNGKSDCACFDISLGCSGYVYGLSVIQSFMQSNRFRRGLLFTADPYSKIVDSDDKNTSLLFGDAATVTLIADEPVYSLGICSFGTLGTGYLDLSCSTGGKLQMNGRAVFNFTATHVPEDIRKVVQANGFTLETVDRFVFHQASKYIIDTLSKKLNLDASKVAYAMYEYGNTVSSSIPIILERELATLEHKSILISGFGVGLSYASAILKRVEAGR